MIYLELPFPPSVNHMYVRRGKGRLALSDEARAFRELVALIARPCIDSPLEGSLAVTITLYRPRRRGDIDNTTKATLDALNGIVWHDDKQIDELHIYRKLDREDPRAEVTIEQLEA